MANSAPSAISDIPLRSITILRRSTYCFQLPIRIPLIITTHNRILWDDHDLFERVKARGTLDRPIYIRKTWEVLEICANPSQVPTLPYYLSPLTALAPPFMHNDNHFATFYCDSNHIHSKMTISPSTIERKAFPVNSTTLLYSDSVSKKFTIL